jgi:hypothetical protein
MNRRRKSSTEAVREWRKANPERASEASRDAMRRYRAGTRLKWAEIARQAAEADARERGGRA